MKKKCSSCTWDRIHKTYMKYTHTKGNITEGNAAFYCHSHLPCNPSSRLTLASMWNIKVYARWMKCYPNFLFLWLKFWFQLNDTPAISWSFTRQFDKILQNKKENKAQHCSALHLQTWSTKKSNNTSDINHFDLEITGVLQFSEQCKQKTVI